MEQIQVPIIMEPLLRQFLMDTQQKLSQLMSQD